MTTCFLYQSLRKEVSSLFIVLRVLLVYLAFLFESQDVWNMEYYSAIKKNSFESVLMRWMKLEPITQGEVSQKEKHQYSILMHIYGT